MEQVSWCALGNIRIRARLANATGQIICRESWQVKSTGRASSTGCIEKQRNTAQTSNALRKH
jgi:hypothetical protein